MFRAFFLSFVSVQVLIPKIDGSVRFTQVPPFILYVSNGGTAKFFWDYHVDNRNTNFSSTSPQWEYTNITANHTYLIATETLTLGTWKWSVTSTCPPSLKHRINKESTATLVITNVKPLDNGVYTCGLFLSGGQSPIRSVTTLVVTVRPKFSIHPPSSFVIPEYSNLAVLCAANGQPTPNVTWKRLRDQRVLSIGVGSARLDIPIINRDQNGTYECQAVNNPNESPLSTQTTVVVQYPPSITTGPKETTVTKGDRIILTCRANGNPLPTIYWSKEGGTIKPGHTSGNILVIPDAVKSDAGKYICTAKNFFGMATHTATAFAYVMVKYQPTIVSKSRNQIINETNSLSLKCTADGYPLPNITWTKSPGTITPSVTGGSVYSIPSVKKSDAGMYTCKASNGIGNDVHANIQIAVQYKAEINPSESTKATDSWNGKLITLRCSFTGNPTPSVKWFKPSGSEIITPDVRTTYNGDVYSSQLNITTKVVDDYGKYKCVGRNPLGSKEYFFLVKQLFTPYQPKQANTVSDSKGTQITIFWCVPDVKGGTPVIDYKVEINTSPPREIITKFTFTEIKDLKENTYYIVKVYARNKAGYGDPVSKAIVTENPENHMTFIISSLITILVISLVANMLFVITFIRTQRAERKWRLSKRSSKTSYENKSIVEMESLPGFARSSLTDIHTDGCTQSATMNPVTDHASHYQSLSPVTRDAVNVSPPKLYESVLPKGENSSQGQYASIQLKNPSNPKTRSDLEANDKTEEETKGSLV